MLRVASKANNLIYTIQEAVSLNIVIGSKMLVQSLVPVIGVYLDLLACYALSFLALPQFVLEKAPFFMCNSN